MSHLSYTRLADVSQQKKGLVAQQEAIPTHNPHATKRSVFIGVFSMCSGILMKCSGLNSYY